MTRITRLSIRDVKRIKAVDITPTDPNLVTIAGRNAQGKTSVLDSITFAFLGKRAIPDTAPRVGGESPEIIVETDDIVVRRWWTDSGATSLEVTSPDGAVYKSPQALLDAMVGAVAFRPVEFLRADPKVQAKLIRDALGVDTTAAEAEVERAIEERREVNRDLREARIRLDGMAEPGDDWPTEEPDRSDVTARMNEIDAHNAKVTTARNRIDETAREVKRWEDTVERLRRELAVAEETLAHASVAADEAKTEAERLGPGRDRGEVEAALADFDRRRHLYEAGLRYAEAETFVGTCVEDAAALDKRVEDARAKVAALIAGAGLPDGLSIRDGIVYFGDVPLSEASASEQVRAACAVAFTGNPKIRVAIVEDGSLLDDGSMSALHAMAEERDFQVWVEKVGDEPGAVIIEDGTVRDLGEASDG